MADISFNITCKELKIAQIAQLNQPFQLLHLVHIQLFRERLSKKSIRQSRKVLWVVLSSPFFKEIWKNGIRGRGRMFAHAKGKQEVLTAKVSGTVYWSYPILTFGIVAYTFLPTTFLEIAVYGHGFYELSRMLMRKDVKQWRQQRFAYWPLQKYRNIP